MTVERRGRDRGTGTVGGFGVTIVIFVTVIRPTALGTLIPGPTPARTMGLDMFGEMVRSHEPLITDRTGETLLTRMSSKMTLELIRPSKPLPAKQPVTNKRPFS